MRKIDYYTFNDKDKFLEVCKENFDILHNKYGYYFPNLCSGIKDIEILLNKKKDFYNHRCNVYYTDDECYFVEYRKNDIIVEVLLECIGSQIAHKLAKDLEKMNFKKAEEIKPW